MSSPSIYIMSYIFLVILHLIFGSSCITACFCAHHSSAVGFSPLGALPNFILHYWNFSYLRPTLLLGFFPLRVPCSQPRFDGIFPTRRQTWTKLRCSDFSYSEIKICNYHWWDNYHSGTTFQTFQVIHTPSQTSQSQKKTFRGYISKLDKDNGKTNQVWSKQILLQKSYTFIYYKSLRSDYTRQNTHSVTSNKSNTSSITHLSLLFGKEIQMI